MRVWLLLLNFCSVVFCEKIQIPIGGIFHESHLELEITFNAVVEKINFYEKEFELIPIIKRVLEYDGYQTEKAGQLSALVRDEVCVKLTFR